MTKIKNFFKNKPVLFSLLMFFLFVVLVNFTPFLYSFINNAMLNYLVSTVCDLIWPLAITVLLGYGFALKLKGFGKSLIAGAFVLVWYSLLLISDVTNAFANPETQWRTVPEIILGVLTMLGVGIREEVFFRGIIGNSLALKYGTTTKGLWFAVLLSSFMFGCVHLGNLMAGVAPIGVLTQTIAGTALGSVFIAIYLRGGSIWIPVIIHAIIDTSGLFASTFTQSTVTINDEISGLSIVNALVVLPIFLGISAFLLRKSKRPAVFARLEELRGEVYN